MAKQERRWLTWVAWLVLATAAPAAAQADEEQFTIETAIAAAIDRTPRIEEAIQRVRAQEEALKGSESAFFPKLAAAYSYSALQNAPYTVFGPTQVPMGTRDNVHWDVTLTQPVFTGFALSTRKKMAELGVDMTEAGRLQAVHEMVKEVKLAYYRILRTQKLQAVADEAVTQLAAHAKDAQQFFDQGLLPYNDLLKSQVALAFKGMGDVHDFMLFRSPPMNIHGLARYVLPWIRPC